MPALSLDSVLRLAPAAADAERSPLLNLPYGSPLNLLTGDRLKSVSWAPTCVLCVKASCRSSGPENSPTPVGAPKQDTRRGILTDELLVVGERRSR